MTIHIIVWRCRPSIWWIWKHIMATWTLPGFSGCDRYADMCFSIIRHSQKNQATWTHCHMYNLRKTIFIKYKVWDSILDIERRANDFKHLRATTVINGLNLKRWLETGFVQVLILIYKINFNLTVVLNKGSWKLIFK